MAQLLVQQQFARFQTVATGSTVIPYDNTRPQNTEGDMYMSVDFTPKFADSTLEIEVVTNLAFSVAGSGITAALFRGLDLDCKAASTMVSAGNNYSYQLIVKHFDPALNTTPTKFMVRCGGAVAGTTTFNGQAATGLFNNTLASYILIREWREQ